MCSSADAPQPRLFNAAGSDRCSVTHTHTHNMPPFDKTQLQNKPFKLRKNFVTRKQEAAGIRSKFSNKIPVIIERYEREKFLPPLDKTKFLVPHELTMTQFVTIIRNRMALLPTQAFYLLIDNSGLASMSLTMAQVYKDHQDEDGFLYMTYASQEMFGH
ncbi:microtubule-associated proteins 1A/1B light chain 3C-like [Sparus aurata]|uniref:Microtubule-associated protein 1 light chain 3 gamma n=1 Tax=Sparus aurata TaxID=8175 RepID=A0A671VCN5_SPAAU|nr:microtubule-associated proteins 1A/1B light chain 3C-like [Sparus aurata]XP_030267551.1 microtubule-associated proteins 1A/1B light chain 3C-like [Sparus aurata]